MYLLLSQYIVLKLVSNENKHFIIIIIKTKDSIKIFQGIPIILIRE